MRALVQRVSEAKVIVEGEVVGAIEKGLLVFLGVCRDDRPEMTHWLADKVCALRIFPDEADKMNLNVSEAGGNLLVVSQFTLCASCQQGRRPDFGNAAPPEVAEPIYRKFVSEVGGQHPNVQTGKFQAKMDVHLVNDGPVTFLVEGKD